MIAFKYTKTDGAEYLSHLDLLRHIDRTLRRAGIFAAKSQGFNRHPRIFLNNPLGTGIKSVAEYGAADVVTDGDFKEIFNKYSPDGVKCLGYRYVNEKPNYANGIVKCAYEVKGVAQFDPSLILDCDSIIICDLRGRQIDVRPRIYGIQWKNDVLELVLGCGENNLRPDLLCSFLSEKFGGCAYEIVKVSSFGENVF